MTAHPLRIVFRAVILRLTPPPPNRGKKLRDQLELKEGEKMATLDWAQCPAVESIPGKRSGAWVFRDTRTPVSVVFDNLEVGASINEIMDWFHLSHEQVIAVIEFAARSLDAPSVPAPAHVVDAHTLR
jgi:uncharacterized protein (DUF433 family)